MGWQAKNSSIFKPSARPEKSQLYIMRQGSVALGSLGANFKGVGHGAKRTGARLGPSPIVQILLLVQPCRQFYLGHLLFRPYGRPELVDLGIEAITELCSTTPKRDRRRRVKGMLVL